MIRHGKIVAAACICVPFVAALALFTAASLEPLPLLLAPCEGGLRKVQFLDRSGGALSRTYENAWNFQDQRPLHQIPEFLQVAFLAAEDQRFYAHSGTDWRGLAAAIFQNITALRVVRGGSTLSEQVVRMLQPRARNFWSRWLEVIEARELEARFSKADIFEFYLNQVPYARNRRGVASAALDLFDRDLSTLSKREMLVLAVLVRAPGQLDPKRALQDTRLQRRMEVLTGRLVAAGRLSAGETADFASQPLELRASDLPVQAAHFLRFAAKQLDARSIPPLPRLRTTLDGTLQSYLQKLLDRRVSALRTRGVSNAAALVVDNERGEVLAWVNVGRASGTPGSDIDAVLAPRQPGSTLKPFLYAQALTRGWTAATIIEDAPLAHAVGAGLKPFKNYSGHFYGPVRLREALGNSLNIPAVHAVKFVGHGEFYKLLRELGFDTLSRHPDYYGEGLALGNGEVRLYDLVRAYLALARQGRFEGLRIFLDSEPPLAGRERPFLPEITSLIGSMLSDPVARQEEFGHSSLLNFPVQTAVKTGTSTDYRDAWALGYSARFTAGVWMGNLDRRPMQEITGSTGPAVVLRAVFAELERTGESRPLPINHSLMSRNICRTTGKLAGPACPVTPEWFMPGTEPREPCSIAHKGEEPPSASVPGGIELELPTPGLQIALDPRIPDEREALTLQLPAALPIERVEWIMDGSVVGRTGRGERKLLWPLKPGPHTVQAKLWTEPGQERPLLTPPVSFNVKGRLTGNGKTCEPRSLPNMPRRPKPQSSTI